jgi:hypothetical protein
MSAPIARLLPAGNLLALALGACAELPLPDRDPPG